MDILSINPYAQFFRSLNNRDLLENLQICIRSDVRIDQRVYNAPTVSQVAAIWIEGDSTSFIERDIILTSHSGTYRKIKHYFGCYDPLQYPILFPNGEVGWHQNINRNSRFGRNEEITRSVIRSSPTEEELFSQQENGIKRTSKERVSCREYYSYKLQIREHEKSVILYAGRLLHQYVVDMYVKIETSRLDFYKQNQHTIRSDLYKGIIDSVAAGETQSNNTGKRIILPPSFIGGPRDMRRRYLDAMALCQRFGKPDLFITMTCNPDWQEIKNELKPGQTAQDRPDLTTHCLNDASNYQMPNALRQLFAILLIYCEPTNVLQLWNEYYTDLSHDYQAIKDISYDDCVSKTLLDINLFLERMGRSIDDFDLPELPHVQEIFHDLNDELNNREISEERNVITPAEDLNIIHTLNSNQKNAFVEIINRVNQKRHGIFFIDGPGGTGKTYLYRAILSTLRNEGHIAIATATSGVAASILPGGRTAHSRFKIPINSTETTLCAITKQSGLAQLLKQSSIILWDEAPMVKRTAIETLDRTMKDIMNSSISFGGKVIVFGGDFRQVLPVVRRASRSETISYSMVKSYLWEDIEVFKLKENMRARTDHLFSEFILRIGNGDEEEIEDGLVHIPNEMMIEYSNNEASEHSLICTIFPSLCENFSSSEYIMERLNLMESSNLIKSLSLNQRYWSITAVINQIDAVKMFKSGQGKIQKLTLMDKEGSKIYAIMFNETIDKFHNMLQLERLIYFQMGKSKL
ncbi:hypothetical protein KFK09_023418 [Dendrobium nobile]|uniref:ATP-dependent DNA helicase n=1 Tax=Dendrobium nobile TaxID=94219 RepID=A0A8T3ALV3_DENNO|nr:hypothetical protein KFK09_023418 [Dendrobium nobile]